MRNLIYHVWPKKGSMWLWNLHHLLNRIEQFDGVRSIGIAVSEDSESAETVKAIFEGHRIDNWIVEQNDRNRGETVTFYKLLATLPKTGVSFYGHAKGVSHTAGWAEEWTSLMYEINLDYPSLVDDALGSFSACSAFTQNDGFLHNKHGWYPAGSFYWFRNEDVFSNDDWKEPKSGYWGSEVWLGDMIPEDKKLALCGDYGYPIYIDAAVARARIWWENKKMDIQDQENFCYFTGTNRVDEKGMIESMIESARKAGVTQDFHVFAPFEVADAINHPISKNRSWNRHMAKIEFLYELKSTSYHHCCWLDTDNYFVRKPDIASLIRDEKCWVSMESDLTLPYPSPDDEPGTVTAKFKEWYSVYLHPTKTEKGIQEMWRQYGAGRFGFYNTNGGLFIVRTDNIQEFHDKCFEVFNAERANGGPDIPDEVPLAIVGDAMVRDPLLNRFSKHSHVWACDWHSTFTDKLPDGNPWKSRDWLSGEWGEMINPAIVHLMRGKNLLKSNSPTNKALNPVRLVVTRNKTYLPVLVQPSGGVGTEVSKILESIGVPPETCDKCRAMMLNMDRWGADGCDEEHREEILTRLRLKVAEATVAEKLNYAFKSLLTGLWKRVSPIDPAEGILNEAIRIARLNPTDPQPEFVPQQIVKSVSRDIPFNGLEDRVAQMYQELHSL